MQDKDKYSGFTRNKESNCPKIRYGKGGGGGRIVTPPTPPPAPPAPVAAPKPPPVPEATKVNYDSSKAKATANTSKFVNRERTILTSASGLSDEDANVKRKSLLGG